MQVKYIVTIDFGAFDLMSGEDIPEFKIKPKDAAILKELAMQGLKDAHVEITIGNVCVASSVPNDVQEVEQ